MPAAGKKLHHFVWRFYLRQWAPGEQIFCLQNGKITPRNLEKVGAENYFYRLNEISPADAEFIENLIIKDSPEGLKESHRFLIRAFRLPHTAKRKLEDRIQAAKEAGQELDEKVVQESRALIEQQIIELNENYHNSIEGLFQPILEALQAGNLTFLQEQEKRHAFYYGLSVQYARTNHVKGTRQNMKKPAYELYTRIANVLTHIMAINVGHSWIGQHDRNQIVILENASEIPFVTADQPAINLSSNPTNFDPPTKFDVYYPLSPTRALMVLEQSSAHLPDSASISGAQVHHYNLLIAAHSYRQVYSNSPAELEAINAELEAFLSCFRGLPNNT
jgi:hypothetical protein